MSSIRPRALLASTLIVAATALLGVSAGRAIAAPGPTPTSTSTSSSTPTQTATTPAPDPSGLPPGRPGDLRAIAASPGSITLAWTASAVGCCPVTGYRIGYIQRFNDVVMGLTVAGDATTVTITAGIRGTSEFNFTMYAFDEAGRVSDYAFLTVVTPATVTGDTTPPSAPRLELTEMTPTGPALSWTASTDDVGVTGYNVYFFDGWYTSTQVGTTTGTSFVAPFMSSSTGMHYYYVRARDAAGNLSAASGTVRSTAPATTSPPPPARTCQVAYRTTSEWTGGFVAEVTVTNTGTAPVDGWAVTFPVGGDQVVTSSWHATFTQAGSEVTLTGANWNRVIPAGGSVTAGLIGRWTASNAAPPLASLNGGACTLT